MAQSWTSREAIDRRLLRRYREHGDVAARDRLVQRMQPFVGSTARQYAGRSHDIADLRQVANYGLIKAIERFDLSRGLRFIAYAAPTIQGEIKRYFRDHSWAVHVPRSVQEAFATVNAHLEPDQTYSDAEIRRIATGLGMDEAMSENVAAATRSFSAAGLDQPLNSDGMTIADAFGQDDAGYDRVEQRATIDRALDAQKFSDEDRAMLHMRYFEDLHQREIGERLGRSQMHASRRLRLVHDGLAAQGKVWNDAA